MEQAPEIIPLRDEDEIADKEISGKAARYFRETNQLFVNLNYSAVAAAQEHLELRYATYEDPDWQEREIVTSTRFLDVGSCFSVSLQDKGTTRQVCEFGAPCRSARVTQRGC